MNCLYEINAMNGLYEIVHPEQVVPLITSRMQMRPEQHRRVIPKLQVPTLFTPHVSLTDSIGVSSIAVPRCCESQLTYSKARLDKLKRLHGYFVEDSGSQTDRSEEIAQLDELLADCMQMQAMEGNFLPPEQEWLC